MRKIRRPFYYQNGLTKRKSLVQLQCFDCIHIQNNNERKHGWTAVSSSGENDLNVTSIDH